MDTPTADSLSKVIIRRMSKKNELRVEIRRPQLRPMSNNFPESLVGQPQGRECFNPKDPRRILLACTNLKLITLLKSIGCQRFLCRLLLDLSGGCAAP